MRIRWRKNARESFRQTSNYIRQEFGVRHQQKYLREILETANLLRLHPNLGHPEQMLADLPILYRSLVIKPYNKLIYTITDDTIEIVALWDTRRDPNSLTEEVT